MALSVDDAKDGITLFLGAGVSSRATVLSVDDADESIILIFRCLGGLPARRR
jgi:hypothetical protein